MSLKNNEKTTLSLKTADGEVFVVDDDLAMEFNTVKNFFDEDGISRDVVLPLPNVSSVALVKIINYCKKHLELRAKKSDVAVEDNNDANKAVDDEIKAFKSEFVKDESNDDLKELIMASNYLDIKELLGFLNQTVADRIKNKSVEYVRRFFGIENDFTPEEEATLREEYAWAFEGVDED